MLATAAVQVYERRQNRSHQKRLEFELFGGPARAGHLRAGRPLFQALWLLCTIPCRGFVVMVPLDVNDLKQGVPMTKILAALLATLVAVSVACCAGVGKGKAPPPVVTKG